MSQRPLAVRTRALADDVDLLAVMATPTAFAWVRDGQGLIGWGRAVELPVGTGRRRLTAAGAALADVAARADVDDPLGVPGSGLVAFCSATFDAESGGSVLVVPEVIVGRRDGVAWVTTVGDAEAGDLSPIEVDTPGDRTRYAGGADAELGYLDAVGAASARIRAGELDKVVLARAVDVWSRTSFDPRRLAVRLAGRYPTCWTYAVDGLVGATPELLAGVERDRLTSLVLAGTAARGGDQAQDDAIAAALLASDKDVAEHRVAVESVRTALGGRTAELAVDAAPHLLRLANVMHLGSWVRGRLPQGVGVLQAVDWLHPTAAVAGTPTDLALATIRELEPQPRGRYAGPVGWVGADGGGELGIALRCAQLDGTRARLFAGGGIMGESLPESELEETRLKLAAIQHALDT